MTDAKLDALLERASLLMNSKHWDHDDENPHLDVYCTVSALRDAIKELRGVTP